MAEFCHRKVSGVQASFVIKLELRIIGSFDNVSVFWGSIMSNFFIG